MKKICILQWFTLRCRKRSAAPFEQIKVHVLIDLRILQRRLCLVVLCSADADVLPEMQHHGDGKMENTIQISQTLTPHHPQSNTLESDRMYYFSLESVLL